jgi:hypothetical protein
MAVEGRMCVSINGLAVVLLTWMCQGSELVVTKHGDMTEDGAVAKPISNGVVED